MREKHKKEKRSCLANTAKHDLFFPLFFRCFSHPIHNPLTLISECKDTTKNLNLQGKITKKCRNYNYAMIFTFSQQIRYILVIYINIPKTFEIIKKIIKIIIANELFSLSFLFPFSQLSVYKYAIIQKSRFHRRKSS